MSQLLTLPWFSAERKLSGTTRVLLGFITGALFGLLPVYYFYMGRDVALRGPGPQPTEGLTEAVRATPSAPPQRGTQKPFASRMTYELSQLPEEPPPLARKAPPTPPPAAATQQARAPVTPAPAIRPEEPVSTARIVNARPINAAPPEPRDTTREIEKEAKKPEYREQPARQQAKAPPLANEPRIIEGRDIDIKALKLPSTPTRPIVAGASGNSRVEIEAERRRANELAPPPTVPDSSKKAIESRTVVAAGPPVAGVTAIKPAPSALARTAAAPARPPEKAGVDVAVTSPAAEARVAPAAEARVAPAAEARVSPTAEARVAPPAEASATPVAGSSDLVEGRLSATREWLAAAPQTTHTIQLMGTNSEEQLRNHLKSLSKVLDASKLYVYRTVAQGKPSITVVYGAYADRQSALQALEKLPAAITANRPVLRTVKGISTELKQRATP